MIKLGNIEYSNCYPVHAQLLEAAAPGVEIVGGIPSRLNSALAEGSIDVSPSSSIEYARHAGDYRLLRNFVIGSDGAVGSILFESTRDIGELHDAVIAVPTASATSVALLKILLALQHGVQARYRWFEQSDTADPVRDGAHAALWIGDVALRRVFNRDQRVYDLGAEWRQWTGLPFVFAAWQTSAPPERDGEIARLDNLLLDSYAWFQQHAEELAARRADSFGLSAERLLQYWQSLRYRFDERMQQGLLEYYRLAAQLGEAPAVAQLNWVA